MSSLWKPRKYQKTGVTWLVKHPEAALFWDPGLGKTTVTLTAFQALYKAKSTGKMLVIAPKRVCYLVWSKDSDQSETSKWLNFHDLKIALLHGTEKDEALATDADIYLINPAGLKWLIESGGLKSLLKRGVNHLTVDELSQFKHTDTKQFRQLRPWLRHFKRRWGLTGSPASNGLLDLFGQCYTLDLGKALGRYITHYRHQYFLPAGFGGYDWKLQEGAETKIYKAIRPLALSMRCQDHLDLPDLVEQDLWVNLDAKSRKAYGELEQDLITVIDELGVSAANAAVASGKCRQVASGGLYVELDDGERTRRKVIQLHTEKSEVLKDLVAELQGSPLLVAYEFDHDLVRIREALGDVPAINGKTKGKETVAIANAWNRGEIPVLCGHPAAMGYGLNLQDSGSHVVWYSPTWNYELYDQANRRVYRQGTKAKRVVIYRILARKTIDEDVVEALRAKGQTQVAVFEALKRRVDHSRKRAAS